MPRFRVAGISTVGASGAVIVALLLVGCTADDAPTPTTSAPVTPAPPPAQVADFATWFGEIPDYSAFDLSTGVPSQPIFLRERGTIDGSALDGTRARAVSYETLADPTGLVRQNFTATALFITTPADEASQVAAVSALVAAVDSMPAGWQSSSVETRAIGAHDYFVLDSVQSMNGTMTNTRSWVAVIGSYLVTVTFDWSTAEATPSVVTPVYTADEVAAQTGAITGLLASIP